MKSILKNKRLFIRADADSVMGTGHIMRCLALAQGWQDCDGEVVFVGKITSATMQQEIVENGFDYIDVKQSFPAPEDLGLLMELIQKNDSTSCPWVVVDGYHFTADYTQSLRQAGAKVLLIDDYAHQAEYSVDLLLNQNLGSEGLTYKINHDSAMLLGNKYILLRREFLREQDRENKDAFPKEARRILVTLGGSDPENATLKIIEALDRIDLPQLEVKIIVGPANPYLDLLKERMVHVSFRGKLVTDVKNMVPLMLWADLAISAGGSTCWELAYLGVSFFVVTVAENQERIADSLNTAGAAYCLGWAQTLDIETLSLSFASVVSSESDRLRLSANGKRLVDGRGAQRVIENMKEMS